MKVKFVTILALACCLLALPVSARCQQSPDYNALIQQGQAELQATPDQALASGEQAIKLDASRWEGYALAGGALMNLKHYDQAVDRLTDAIERAPQSKQEGLRELRRQCLAAQSGTSKSVQDPTQTGSETSVTQAEIVMWKSIENSTNPADFQGYLNQYPHGAFAALAQKRLADAQQGAQKESEALRQQQEESVWTDPDTGLMWTRNDNGADIAAGQAGEYCSNLRLLGYSDWRVPTYGELKNIHAKSWTGRGKIRSEFHLADGTGNLWTSSRAGLGSYYSGKQAVGGYDIIPEPNKADGIRTLCVRK